MLYRSPLPVYSGAAPGKLDPNQPSRILHDPSSTLSFATYNPYTARNDLREPSDSTWGEGRIVIETTATGTSTWRRVPRAILDNVRDEGLFPREVEYCGIRIVLSQEQWDIHKLDPAFLCTVHPHPRPPTIQIKPPSPEATAHNNTHPELSTGLHTPPHNSEPASPSKRPQPRSFTPEEQSHPKRRPRTTVEEVKDDYSEGAMSVDEVNPQFNFPQPPPFSAFNCKFQPAAGMQPPKEQPQNNLKRKLSPPGIRGHATVEPCDQESKRYRATETPSPKPFIGPNARALGKAYQRRKEERLKQRKMDRPNSFQNRHMAFMEEFNLPRKKYKKRSSDEMSWTWTPPQNFSQHVPGPTFFPQPGFEPPLDHPHSSFAEPDSAANPDPRSDSQSADTPRPGATPDASPTPEPSSSHQRWASEPTHCKGDRHRQELLESMRKMRELEKDRPLWEDEARKRRLREERDAQEQEAKRRERAKMDAELERGRAESKDRARSQQIERDEHRERLDKEEFLRRQRQRRARAYQYVRSWSQRQALEEYEAASKRFDSFNFNGGVLINFECIPWPVGKDPHLVILEDITWDAIESFFAFAEACLGPAGYKILVRESHLRFHPDRWKSRNILNAVSNMFERKCLEQAINTTSQVLAPIWSRLRANE